MTQLVDSSGKLVEVPDEQAPSAFLSGKYGLPGGKPVRVVGQDGTVGTVAPEQAQAAFADGARFATDQEFHHAQVEARHGGVLGGLAAGAEGAARGLTLGLSDPFAVGAARFLGGDETAEKVRTHLAEEKEAHPWLSVGGEIAGAAAPMLLGAPTEASAISSISDGVRTLGVLPRGVGALGEAAEHAMAGVLGETAMSALGKAGQAAAKSAVGAMVQGGLFGAGQQISESTLQNAPLTAEKLFSTVTHAALTAGLIGGAAGGLTSLGSSAVKAALPAFQEKLEGAAGEQTWRWLDPKNRYSVEATKRAGGTSAVGQTVYDEIVRPLIAERGLTGAAIDNDQKLELVQKALDAKGKAIGEIVGSSNATIPLQDMLRPIDDAMAEMRGRVGHEGQLSNLQSLKKSVIRVLGGEPGAAAAGAAAPVERTPEELAQFIRDNPGMTHFGPDGSLADATRFKMPESAPPALPLERDVPIAQAIEQRRALQDLAFKESKALDPNMRVQLLRGIAGSWNGLEEKALNEASEEIGGQLGTQLRGLNKQFQRLKLAESALSENTARYATNRMFSLSDSIFGGAHFGGALAAGHPLGAAGALGTMIAHKALRSHGNLYAAVLLDRLASMGGLAQTVAEHDGQIGAAVEEALSSAPTKRLPRIFHTSSASTEKFDEEESRVRQLASIGPGIAGAHIASQLAGLGTQAPGLAQAVQGQTMAATKFLVGKLPTPQTPNPFVTEQGPSAQEKLDFLRYVDAVNGGPVGILQRVAKGTHTPQDLEVLSTLYGQSKAEIAAKLQQAAADKRAATPYQQRLRLAQAFGPAIEPSLTPLVLQSLQAAYQSGAHAAASDAEVAKPTTRAAGADHLKTPDLLAGMVESTERKD